MVSSAANSSQEYWRPPHPEVMRLVDPIPVAAACWRCGAAYSPGARFCHICGSEGDPGSPTRAGEACPERSREARGGMEDPLFTTPTNEPEAHSKAARLDDLRRYGPAIARRVFFLIGLACMMTAALTGFVYKAQTLVEWQAVQIWRIEWLLGAAAALLAGIVLQRK